MNLDHLRGRSIRNRIIVTIFIYIVIITCSYFILAPKLVGIPIIFQDAASKHGKTWRFRYEISNMAIDSKLIISKLIGAKSENIPDDEQTKIQYSMRIFATDKLEAKDIYLQYKNDFELMPYELEITYPDDVSNTLVGNCNLNGDNWECSDMPLY